MLLGKKTKLILDIKELSNHVIRTDNHYFVICHPNIMTDPTLYNKFYESLIILYQFLKGYILAKTGGKPMFGI